jgi:C1A family cysteine protease
MKKTVIGFIAFLLLILISSPLLAINAEDVNKAIRDKGADWVAGETAISKLPPEAKKRLASLIPASNLSLKAKSNKVSAEAVIPARVDWRNFGGHNYITGIRDQGECGSCYAFAATAVLESRILITSHTPDTDLDLSEQSMVSCDTNNMGCDGGFLDSAFDFLKTTGATLESCYPYTSGESGIAGDCIGCADWRQNTYKITSFEDVSTSVKSIKSSIAEHGPVMVGFIVYSDFFYYKSGIYRHITGLAEGGHAVAIVGYDDTERCWIVKNSWGPNWGENGFFRIAAGTNECEIEKEVYAIDYATVPGTSFVLSPSTIDFGTLLLPDQPFLTQSFTITNNGSVPLTNTSLAVTSPQYSVIPLTGSSIESAASADVQVTYTPLAGKTPDTAELDVDSAGITRSITLSGQANTRPVQPVNLWPPDGGAPATGKPVTLSASWFVDDDGDAHEASQWIIKDSSGTSVYSGSFDTVSKTSFTVPSEILQADRQYFWQVIYRDDRGVISSASAWTSFTPRSSEPGKGTCFIATAGSGSPMDGHVEIPGQFIASYYRSGHTAANCIKGKPLRKAAIRVVLHPLTGFSLLLISGYPPFLIVGFLLSALLFFRFKSKMLNVT